MNAVENVHTAVQRVTRPGFTTSARGRWISVAGAIYVTAWVVGLVVAPETPAATAPAAEVHAYYAANGTQILVQSSLIHGVAAVAIAALALLVPAATGASPRLGKLIVVFGLGASVVSLLQVAFAVAGVVTAGSQSVDTSARLFDALNLADTIKLILLAGFAAAVTTAATRAGMTRGWTRWLTLALVVTLPVGGMAFLVDSPVLMATLYASLPLLLIWAGALAWQIGRRAD